MTRRVAIKISSAALWSLIATTVVMAANADEDRATAAETGWACAAAAAEYRRYFGDDITIPETLIEGEISLLELRHCPEIIAIMAIFDHLFTTRKIILFTVWSFCKKFSYFAALVGPRVGSGAV